MQEILLKSVSFFSIFLTRVFECLLRGPFFDDCPKLTESEAENRRTLNLTIVDCCKRDTFVREGAAMDKERAFHTLFRIC